MEMDAPPALPAHVVTLLLSYLTHLDGALPPHLISAPLRQRHHFIGLGHVLDTAQDASAYLSWPSFVDSEDDTARRIADLLSALPSPEDVDPLIAYPTKYSSDGEAVYAHAKIPLMGSDDNGITGLRLIFRWEAKVGEGVVIGHQGSATNADNWKYHDAKPMPFPPDTHELPQDALHPVAVGRIATAAHVSQPTPTQLTSSSVPIQYHPAIESDSEDDEYWNAYGRSNSDDEGVEEAGYNSSLTAAHKENDEEKAEEAYWAQYASVHGSADSTRHSPLPPKRNLHDPSQPVAVHSSDHLSSLDRYNSQELLAPDVIRPAADDPYSIEHIEHLRHFSQDGSPTNGALSPETLARRLHNISPRPSHSPSPAPPDVDTDPIRLEQLERLESLLSPDSSPDTSDGQSLTPPSDTVTNGIPQVFFSASSPISSKNSEAFVEAGLQDAIRGVYRLWTATRKSEPIEAPEQKEEFIDIVRGALTNI